MEIRVQTLKFDADQKLLDYVDKKVAKLERFDDNITSVEVVLSLMERPDNKAVKLQANVPSDALVVEKNAKTFEEDYAAIEKQMQEEIAQVIAGGEDE